MYTVTLIPGDGIGPEVAAATMKVLEATGVAIHWDIQSAGEAVYQATGALIPPSVFESIEKNKIVLKGPITTPIGKGFRSLNVHLRKTYDLFANVRPVKNLGTVKSRFEHVDLVIFRENTEDLYAGLEEMISPDEAHSIKVITRSKSTRIAVAAFDYARKTAKTKVTVVTKANIMKFTDGLFLEVARDVAKNYPELVLEEVLVDNMCMQLVMDPSKYQVILTENLYGDILSDLCAGLIGGLGLVPSANIGTSMAMFEAAHGSAPDIAGKNWANPTALILSGAMMLEYLGETEACNLVRKAVDQVLSDPLSVTRDLGGTASTTDFTQKMVATIRELRG